MEQIYSANNNEIKAVKINNIVFARFSINMPDITERTLTFPNKYAVARGMGHAIHLERNGKLAGTSWLSREDDTASAKGTLSYKAANDNYGSYTGTAIWFTD